MDLPPPTPSPDPSSDPSADRSHAPAERLGAIGDGSGTGDPDLLGVLLTGGTGERLGGADKAGLVSGGRSLLDRGLAALSAAADTVVVGPPVPASYGAPVRPGSAVRSGRTGRPVRFVRFVREEPAGGGPAAGLLAGIDALDSPTHGPSGHLGQDSAPATWVAVLAVDMPWVTRATVTRLLAAARAHRGGGAVLVDADGRRQLCAVLRIDSLLALRPAEPTGLGFFRLLGGLDLVDVRAVGQEAVDVDTPADLAAWHATGSRTAAALATGPTTDEAGRVNPLDAWLADLTAALGADATLADHAAGPDGAAPGFDTGLLLDLTRVVAHDVVRPAAPLTLFVLGLVAGRTDAGPQELASLVAQVETLVAARSAGTDADEAR